MSEMPNICTDPAVLEAMGKLKKKMERQRFPNMNEKVTQAEVETFLKKEGYTFSREHRLYMQGESDEAPKANPDIPDFLIQCGEHSIVLEVKLRARRMRIYDQIVRYARHPSVHAVMLLTGTSMTLPLKVEQKPAMVISLGQGWL